MTKSFSTLEPEADPLPGMFFLESKPSVADRSFCAGVAFLIEAEGLLATCAHVLVAINRVPGETVVLRGMSPHMPVLVEAEVLEQGWRGPNWEEWSQRPGRFERDWLEECDKRPDVFRQDHALLRIVPGSTRWDPTRGGQLVGVAEERLRSGARVLRLAAPGYARTARPRFKQWRVAYELSAPTVETAYAEFQGLDPSLHDVIQIRSNEIGPGYSGSPIWDPDRERVVGMIRRGMRHDGNNVLGVDARALAKLADLPLHLDSDALRFIELARNTVEAVAPLRHFPLLKSFVPPQLLRLRVRPADSRDPLAPDATPEPIDALTALWACINQPSTITTIVRGGAGAGKSMLMYEFARTLLDRASRVDGLLAVPFPVMAADLRFHDYDVSRLIAASYRSFAMQSDGADLGEDCILRNDLCVVLLVDGIDEIEPAERAKLLARLNAFAKTHSRYRVLATTRPFEDRDLATGPQQSKQMLYLELVALENNDIELLAEIMFPDKDERARFRATLAEIEWDRGGPLPLQLAMAGQAFRVQKELGGRPVDLPFGLVEHLLELGVAEDARLMVARTDAENSARSRHGPRFARIMQRVAACFLHGYTTRDQVTSALRDDPIGTAEFEDVEEVMAFVERETALRGALLHFDAREGTDDKVLVWPHRTFPEALAAEDISFRKKMGSVDVGAEIDRLTIAHGQSFGVVILAALEEGEAGRMTINRFLLKCLDRGASDFKATVFSMRALAAGIVTEEKLRKRMVKTLVTLLLLPPFVRLGHIKCSEVFSMEDMPDMGELANRPRIRPLVIEQLHARWYLRDPRARGIDAPLRIGEREALLLDRLGCWHEMQIQFLAPERALPARVASRQAPPPVNRVANLVESGDAALALDEMLMRLRERADEFMVDFANYVRRAPPQADAVALSRAYLASLGRGLP